MKFWFYSPRKNRKRYKQKNIFFFCFLSTVIQLDFRNFQLILWIFIFMSNVVSHVKNNFFSFFLFFFATDSIFFIIFLFFVVCEGKKRNSDGDYKIRWSKTERESIYFEFYFTMTDRSLFYAINLEFLP